MTTATLPTTIVCAGCGAQRPPFDLRPFRCPEARPGDGIDHVLARTIDLAAAGFEDGREQNPLLRYRHLFHAYHLARAAGLGEACYRALVERLAAAVAGVAGRELAATPLRRDDALAAAVLPGGSESLWIKDETRNIAGSHKCRHLLGIAIFLEVAEQLGVEAAAWGPSPLAVASCGNAALAAAVIARATGRRLDAFLPATARPALQETLRGLGVRVHLHAQDGGAGDAFHRHFRSALAAGAVPFSCQGPDNGLAIEGGQTLGYEMASQLAVHQARLDRLFVQVGGGALASSCAAAFAEAVALGLMERMPMIHAVQSRRCAPLRQAYDRIVEHLLREYGGPPPARSGGPVDDWERAEWIGSSIARSDLEREIRFVAIHRTRFLNAWQGKAESVAEGILDRETHDGLAVVRAMLLTRGFPVLVSEEALGEATVLAEERAGVRASATGAAGLAGLLELSRALPLGADESVAVVLTGSRH